MFGTCLDPLATLLGLGYELVGLRVVHLGMNKCGGWLESDADGTGGGGDDVHGDGDDGDDDLCQGLV